MNPTFQLPPKVLGVQGPGTGGFDNFNGTGTPNFCSNQYIEVEGNTLFRKKNTNKCVKYYSVFIIQHPPVHTSPPKATRQPQKEEPL